jgi:hypothetical protein
LQKVLGNELFDRLLEICSIGNNHVKHEIMNIFSELYFKQDLEKLIPIIDQIRGLTEDERQG